MTSVLRAAFIAPMDRAIIGDGAIAIDASRIIAVGVSREVISEHPDADVRDLGDVVLLPGLVNPHTHLELSLTTCAPRGDATFVEWLNLVRERQDQDAAAAAREGANQCLKYGVTTVGDITQQIRETRSALAGLSHRPRVVSFGEVLGLAKRRARFDELFGQAVDEQFGSPTLRMGLSPHAPYTVDRAGYEQCLRVAREKNLPLTTHLAENPAEREFLESHAGPFRQLWEQIGLWAEPVQTYHGSPIQFADAIGLLAYPTLLAHVNYCDADELSLLARGRASVVYCPRTHRYFSHPPHRWREMLARGINVAVGTDSCASSPDLNLVDELRLLHEVAPDVPVETLWEMATFRAARALRLDDQVGSLTIGKRADIVAFPTVGKDPLLTILESSTIPRQMWIDGYVTEKNPASRG